MVAAATKAEAKKSQWKTIQEPTPREKERRNHGRDEQNDQNKPTEQPAQQLPGITMGKTNETMMRWTKTEQRRQYNRRERKNIDKHKKYKGEHGK